MTKLVGFLKAEASNQKVRAAVYTLLGVVFQAALAYFGTGA